MSEVIVEEKGRALWLTINRPENRNALNNEVLSQLSSAITVARSRAEVRAIVLTGAGDRAFCAGGDVKSGTAKESGPFHSDFSQVEHPMVKFYEAVEKCNLPLIARVNGHAMGGGLGLVACCDIAIASEDVLLATPEVKVGVYPMLISAYLMRLVPRRKLAEMSLTGETLTAAQGIEYGLLNYVVPKVELDAKVSAILEQIVARSPTAIRLGKHAMHTVQDMTLPQCLEFMALMIARMPLTEDAREGMAAFSEKRKPAWTGR